MNDRAIDSPVVHRIRGKVFSLLERIAMSMPNRVAHITMRFYGYNILWGT